MDRSIRSIIALFIIVFIPFGLMLWIRLHQSSGFASIELIVYPLLFGGLSILILLALKKFYLKEDIEELSNGKGSWYGDIGWGVFLTLIYFFLFYIERMTLMGLLRFESNMELLDLMLDLRESPILLILWFGPVLWIGIALYEELIQVFILTTMWKWMEGKGWVVFVILFASILIGLVHWSQGPYGIVTVAIKSVVACIFFHYKRRLMPLVYAHVLYDGIQVAALLMTYPRES